jgi:GNAT superfamily N-acetyltransferase
MTTGRDSRTVASLTGADEADCVSVLRGAFHDYPVMRYVLGDAPDYERRLSTFVRFFVRARLLRSEPIFGVRKGAELAGVALVSVPDGSPGPAELSTLREELWRELGPDARLRYAAFTEASRPLIRDVPRIHLNMLGVRPELAGTDLGRPLLERVHRFAREAPGAQGVSLTTEDPENLSLYARFGYEVVGYSPVAEGPGTWGMFRST